MNENMKFLVGLNTQYSDKVRPGDGRFWDFNMNFHNVTLTMVEFLNAVRAGHAWTAPHHHIRRLRPTRRDPGHRTTYRVSENVISSQLLALDCDTEDERSSFYHLLQDPFIRRYAALLHETASSTPERPRTRVIFLLDQPLSAAEYAQALKALLFKYPYCDQSVNHAAVAFYGSRNCRYHHRDLILPVVDLREQVIHPYQAARIAEAEKRAARRRARLAEKRGGGDIDPDRVTSYTKATFHAILDDLAETPAGLGLRHKKLFTAALKLGSLQVASWLSEGARELLHGVEGRIMDAAVQNGYADDYGEDDTLRTLENGIDIGLKNPWEEPVWNSNFFPETGALVEVWVDDRRVARGHVTAFREKGSGWEFSIDRAPRVWFAQELLRPATSES